MVSTVPLCFFSLLFAALLHQATNDFASDAIRKLTSASPGQETAAASLAQPEMVCYSFFWWGEGGWGWGGKQELSRAWLYFLSFSSMCPCACSVMRPLFFSSTLFGLWV